MMTKVRRCGRGESGFALLSAMIFLVVLLLVGASLVQTSSQELQTASRVRKESRAFNLAEAGIDHAAWKLYYAPSTPLPATWTRTDLPTGTFTVTATRYVGATGPVPNTVVLQSTGVAQGWTSQVKVVGRFLQNPGTHNPIFDYALFSNADLNLGGTTDAVGNLHSNGKVSTSGNAKVTGNASAGGSISEKKAGSITGTKKPFAPKVPMPTIDVAYYRSIATTIVPSGYSFSGDTVLNRVTFVDGDCSIGGRFSGKGTIVVNGSVKMNAGATLVNPSSDALAIVTTGTFHINGHARIEGFVYCHNVDIPAGFTGNGTADVVGGVVADVIDTNGTLYVTYQAPATPLPGDSSAPAQFASISWRRVR